MPEHDAVVAHRRASTPAGPDYCQPCSQTAQDWVPWEGHLNTVDLTRRIAAVLANGGRVADEWDAAEAIVEMMLTAGDLPRDHAGE